MQISGNVMNSLNVYKSIVDVDRPAGQQWQRRFPAPPPCASPSDWWLWWHRAVTARWQRQQEHSTFRCVCVCVCVCTCPDLLVNGGGLALSSGAIAATRIRNLLPVWWSIDEATAFQLEGKHKYCMSTLTARGRFCKVSCFIEKPSKVFFLFNISRD